MRFGSFNFEPYKAYKFDQSYMKPYMLYMVKTKNP